MNWHKNTLAAFGFGLMFVGAVLLVNDDPQSFAAPEAEAPIAEAVTAKPVDEKPYTPTPENLAARKWFQDAKFGIFIHWGTYSVLGRGEWVMNQEKMTVAEYEKLPPQFNPEKFNAAEWVATFKKAGAKYITITSKHHDGFGMWDSKVSDWDIVDRTPYKRDILKQLADECDKQGIKLFFYYSQLDWHHPDYYPRGMTGKTAERPDSGDWEKYIAYMDAQLAELLSGEYGLIGGIWFDGWWDQQTKRGEDKTGDVKKNIDPLLTNQDWHIRRTYDMIHALQPACLIGSNHHVRPFAGEDFQMYERDLPGENKGGHSRDAELGDLPLESCDTMNRSWGYNAEDHRFKSVPDLIRFLVRAAGRDANFLLNVGPRPDGTLDPESIKRLEGVGEWLAKYGDTIYGTHAGPIKPQPWGVSTESPEAIYLHIIDSSKADADGWLTLSGTEELKKFGISIAPLVGDRQIETRTSADGLLEAKVGKDHDQIDIILVAKK
jgi:alpha-L-fucosidase